MKQKLISLAQLAAHTGLSIAWLRRETDEGCLPCLRAGRRRMYNLEAVLRVLNARQREGVRDAQ